MSEAHTPDVVEFKVELASSPDGARNRIVVYDWFTRDSGSSPPRGGNRIEALVDGEQTWTRVADDLDRAQSEVQIATWMCRPDMELRRPEELATSEPGARARFRLGEVLERLAHADVRVRLLIWGMAYTPIVDRWMRRWFWRGHDNIDVLEQDHPTLIGSHHQKTLTIDGRVGYCGGMNLKENDWDTTEHRAWEPRRFPHRADAHARADAVRHITLPPFAPRHDLMVRVEGPAVGDLLHNFAERWQQSLAARRQRFGARLVDALRRRLGGDPAPVLPAPASEQPRAGEQWVQIVRTQPGGEAGILRAYYRAIYNARRYIYIENQYFRSPDIGLALAQALAANPRLRIIVVVWPINEGAVSFVDPSGYYTAQTLQAIRRARPDFELTRLLVTADDAGGERHWLPVDVHAKVMIIDDVWITVGSANINDRGFKTEGEINAVVLDELVATDLRKRLMAEHLGLSPDDPVLDDVDRAFDLWNFHGHENPRLRALEREPLSRVHYFVQDAQDRPPLGVGSGIF
ncbi:MAG TPA: phosphatidylserine/phosphatidylglycerophosphate/cardiolipin synthase family protein [Nannocystaceae bacterium]|nr:phosphatidylserine/phosphatidylglycerophosphate/cardiolipin synthase family protein [Nannocystaceae bacterium]